MFLGGRGIGACQRTSASGMRGAALAASTVCRRSLPGVGPCSISASSDAVGRPERRAGGRTPPRSMHRRRSRRHPAGRRGLKERKRGVTHGSRERQDDVSVGRESSEYTPATSADRSRQVSGPTEETSPPMTAGLRTFCALPSWSSCCGAGHVYAQAGATAQITGTVRDSSGGVLPGVDVTAMQTETGLQALVGHRRERQFHLVQPAHRSVPPGGDAVRVPDVRADRHRAAGQRQPRDQRRRCRSASSPRRCRSKRRRRWSKRAARASGRSSRTSASRSCRSTAATPTDLIVLARRGRAAAGARRHQPQHAGRPGIRRRRRPGVRRGLPARRRDAQQPVRQPEPAAAVPGRAAGVPGRDELDDRQQRHALGRVGERGDQVGHQPVPRRPVRVLAQPPVQRHQPVQRASIRRPASARATA